MKAIEKREERALELKDILLSKTDSNHPINLEMMKRFLQLDDLDANERTIRSDLKHLMDHGLKIQIYREANTNYYYIKDEDRDFQVGEIRLLVDCIQSTRFLSEEQSSKLIAKLKKLTSEHYAAEIQADIVIFNRVKAAGINVFDNIGVLHRAMYYHKKVSFMYWQWRSSKERYYRNRSQRYVVSPCLTEYRYDCYYLVAYDEAEEKIKNFRIDKMENVLMLEESQEKNDIISRINATYSKKQINMFGGEEENVTMLCKEEIAGVMIDYYGQDIQMIPHGDYFTVAVNIGISDQFYGWITGLDDKIQIISPKRIVEEYCEYIDRINRRYQIEFDNGRVHSEWAN